MYSCHCFFSEIYGFDNVSLHAAAFYCTATPSLVSMDQSSPKPQLLPGEDKGSRYALDSQQYSLLLAYEKMCPDEERIDFIDLGSGFLPFFLLFVFFELSHLFPWF